MYHRMLPRGLALRSSLVLALLVGLAFVAWVPSTQAVGVRDAAPAATATPTPTAGVIRSVPPVAPTRGPNILPPPSTAVVPQVPAVSPTGGAIPGGPPTSPTAPRGVNPAITTTNISSSANPSVLGQSITFVASVKAVGANLALAGTVAFRDDGATLGNCGSVSLSGSGQATCTLSTLSIGSHSITAAYSGGTGAAGSSSPALIQTVNATAIAPRSANAFNSKTTILSHNPNPSVVGQGVTVVFSVEPIGGAPNPPPPPGSNTIPGEPPVANPTGTVIVSGDGGQCSAPASAGQCTLAFATAGTKSLVATFVGDSNFNGSTSPSVSHTVNKANTTTTITSQDTDTTNAGDSFTVFYSVSAVAPGGGVPTGTVTVSDGNDSCSASVSDGHCDIALHTVGGRTLTATYDGDSNYNGSTSSGVGHTVNGPSVSSPVVVGPFLYNCTGQYYNNTGLAGFPVFVRIDPAINFYWPQGISPAPGVTTDNYSVLWTCPLNVSLPGVYTFGAYTDDGMNVWVDGVLIIGAWYDQTPTSHVNSIYLNAGGHYVQIAYYNHLISGTAVVSSNVPIASGIYYPLPYAPVPASGLLTNCTGEYFNNTTVSGSPVLARIDPTLNFFWPEGTAPAPGVTNDNYSVRWTCAVNITTPGTYTLGAVTDDGMNVVVDGNLVIGAWRDQGPTPYSTPIYLNAGTHSVRVEYYNHTLGGTAQVSIR